MAGKHCMLSSFISHEGKNTPNTSPSYPLTQSTSVYGKTKTLKAPMFLSSCKKKMKSLKVAKATLAMDFLEEEIKVDVSLTLKVTATVTVKIRNEVSMMKIPWLYSQNDMKHEEKGVGFQLVSTQLDPSN
ncbi:hypothetical protein R6Q59_001999 [Mikania micrantha]